MKKHGQICGSRCLGPMKFLSGMDGNAGPFASRNTSSCRDRFVFLCRAVKVNEKVRIQIKNRLPTQDGHRAVGIGFTNDSPLHAMRDPRHSSRSCIVPLPEVLCLPDTDIEFWMNYAGFVIIRANDQAKYYMKAEGLHLHEPLFVFLDFCGSASTVRLLGSRKGRRTSCSDPIEQALEENLCNLSLISDDNANSDQSVFRDVPPWPAVYAHRSDPVSHRDNRGLKSPHRSSMIPAAKISKNLDSEQIFGFGGTCKYDTLKEITEQFIKEWNQDETDVRSLLRAFQRQYLSSNQIHVIIRRERLLKSALDALSNKNFSWTNKPFIQFAGEEAFDNGGPRREFFRLLMAEVQSSLGIFEGNPKHLFFTYDQSALQKHKYEQAGKLVAWSVVHGGPGLKALDPRLYQLMCGVQIDLTDFDWRLIPDADVQSNARKILSCTTDEHLCALQRELGDWICDCGFPGIYGPNLSIQDIPTIYSYIVRHYIYLRVSNMINQFTEGLNSCEKLWDIVKTNWIDFLPVFTKTSERISLASFRSLFEISWSRQGTKRRAEEEESIYNWELVLKMIEDKETELCFEELLVFVTGSDEIPVLGFPEKPSIHFYQPERKGLRLPYSSTCMMGLFLPRGVRSCAMLNKMLLRAVRNSSGFGKS